MNSHLCPVHVKRVLTTMLIVVAGVSRGLAMYLNMIIALLGGLLMADICKILLALEEERKSVSQMRSDSTGVERRWYDGIVCGLSSAIGIIEAIDWKERWNDTKNIS